MHGRELQKIHESLIISKKLDDMQIILIIFGVLKEYLSYFKNKYRYESVSLQESIII